MLNFISKITLIRRLADRIDNRQLKKVLNDRVYLTQFTDKQIKDNYEKRTGRSTGIVVGQY